MKKYLAAEIDQQLISLTHYQTACSALRQSLVFLQGRIQGNFRDTSRFYQACGNLMHKKRHLARHGDELGTALEIQRLRSELKKLTLKI